MRAAWFDHFGSAKEVLQIGEIDTPVAASGEVLVRLRTSGINPSDVKKRAGSFANLLDDGFVIPNSDGAGIIEAVGDGVDANRIGERVWVYQAQYARRFGTAAEYVAIDAGRAPRLPDNVSFEVGACLGTLTKPRGSAIGCPFRTRSPRATTGAAGAPMCWDSGITSSGGMPASAIGTRKDWCLFSGGWMPPWKS